MERNWRQIRLKDVKYAKSRGEWTEEDDRQWKKEKPFECKCGERFGNRFASGTRHKCRYTGANVVRLPKLPCPEPGCRASFTPNRPDNLEKHRKKYHPRSVITAEEKHQVSVQELTAQFKKFPVAEDLPGPQEGFRLFYSPGKLPFLPPEFLSHYADYYFASAHLYIPFLHQPTFSPNAVLASFIRAVAAIGGLHDPTNRTLSPQLWETGWRILERWMETGPEDVDEQKAAHGTAMIKFEDRESRLDVLQAMVLLAMFGITANFKGMHRKGWRLLQRCIEITRVHGYLRSSTVDDSAPLEVQWLQFIALESRRRTVITLFCVDVYTSLFFNTPPGLRIPELRNLPLPCAEQLFSAGSATQWNVARSSHDISQPTLWTTYKAAFTDDLEPEPVDEADYKFQGLAVMMAALMQVTELQRRVYEDAEIDAHERGDLKVMPLYVTVEADTLMKGIQRIGKRYGGQLFAPPIPEGCPGFFDNECALPTLHKNAGCERLFFFAYHFSHIALCIPDRYVVHDTDGVSSSLDEAVVKMAERTKTAAGIRDDRFLRLLSGDVVLPHLLEVLRYMDSSYDVDDGDTEYPGVCILVYKLLLITWEILVTAADCEEVKTFIAQRQSGNTGGDDSYSWMLDDGMDIPLDYTNGLPDDGSWLDTLPMVPPEPEHPLDMPAFDPNSWEIPPETAMSLEAAMSPQTTIGQVELFWKRIDAIVAGWESSVGLTSVPEDLVVRFVQWAQTKMTEMECWDIGNAAHYALEVLLPQESLERR